MDRIDRILIELEHYKLECERIHVLIEAHKTDLKFLISRSAVLLAELAKLRSIDEAELKIFLDRNL